MNNEHGIRALGCRIEYELIIIVWTMKVWNIILDVTCEFEIEMQITCKYANAILKW